MTATAKRRPRARIPFVVVESDKRRRKAEERAEEAMLHKRPRMESMMRIGAALEDATDYQVARISDFVENFGGPRGWAKTEGGAKRAR